MTTAVPAARRWPVISALGVVTIFTWGSTYYLMTVLAGPIAADTGWSLGSITGALSAGLLVAGLASPRVERTVTLKGRERIVFLLMAAMLVLNGLIVVNISTWLFAFLQAQGLSLATAVALGTLIGPAQVGARVLEMAGGGAAPGFRAFGG